VIVDPVVIPLRELCTLLFNNLFNEKCNTRGTTTGYIIQRWACFVKRLSRVYRGEFL
jgi:hypothetical protein